ncbi:hypothetical protein [Curtobacterium sp. MCSS17_016]|uniref:hypothetical protein n=1 Tax=Curtobacterium sp. MCSS17_016 TaxID=2175644 RepID=UPI0015E89BCD|nr:hypothetical protein [Curtobacterium sp. MCSS17_016]WIE81334.1 hypothetical protein DEJ19_019055 [Curtobacterium sp. MCSS17_016]
MRALERREAERRREELEDFGEALHVILPAIDMSAMSALAKPGAIAAQALSADAARRLRFLTLFFDSVDVPNLDAVLEHTDPALLAKRLSRTIGQGRSDAAAAVGPVFTAAGLAEWKDVSKEALRKAQKAGRLLGFKSRDGVLLYPQFQFNEYGDYLPHLKDVLAVIDPHRVDDGSSAVWLNRPYPSLDGRTAAQALHDGDTDKVLHLAQQIGWVWQEAS